jgi:hypothetical protein
MSGLVGAEILLDVECGWAEGTTELDVGVHLGANVMIELIFAIFFQYVSQKNWAISKITKIFQSKLLPSLVTRKT